MCNQSLDQGITWDPPLRCRSAFRFEVLGSILKVLMDNSVWGLSSCDWSFRSLGPGDEFGLAVLAIKVFGWASGAICSEAKRWGMASKCGSRPVRIQVWCIWAQWKVWLPSFRRTVKDWEGGDVSCQWTTNGCCYCKDSCWGVFLLPLPYWLLWAMQMPYAILTFSFFATMWICSLANTQEWHHSSCFSFQVNWYAAIFASLVSDEDPVFGTEVQYLVDEHGGLCIHPLPCLDLCSGLKYWLMSIASVLWS